MIDEVGCVHKFDVVIEWEIYNDTAFGFAAQTRRVAKRIMCPFCLEIKEL